MRQQVALQKDQLLPISAEGQVCSKFGLHPELGAIRTLYNNGDLLFFANTGVMSQPVTKDDYYILTATQLFAHNTMQEESTRLDPYNVMDGTGVLGRMRDVLTQDGHNTASFSIGQYSVTTTGTPEKSGSTSVVDGKGISRLFVNDEMKNNIAQLHNRTELDSGIFADSFSESLMDSIGGSELLNDALKNIQTSVQFPNTHLGNSLKMISRLIATRKVRGVDVDTFYLDAKRE